MKRNEVFQLRLTPDERAQLHATAQQTGVTASELIRLRVFSSGPASSFDAQDAYEDLERRLSRLEEMANL